MTNPAQHSSTRWTARVLLVLALCSSLVFQSARAEAFAVAPVVAPSVAGLAGTAGGATAVTLGGVALAPLVAAGAAAVGVGLLVRWAATDQTPWQWGSDPEADANDWDVTANFSLHCRDSAGLERDCSQGTYQRYYMTGGASGLEPNVVYAAVPHIGGYDRWSFRCTMTADGSGVIPAGTFQCRNNNATNYFVGESVEGVEFCRAGSFNCAEPVIWSSFESPAGPQGRVEVSAECYDLSAGTTSTSFASSPDYDLAGTPADIPSISCGVGQMLTGLQADRVCTSITCAPVALVDFVPPVDPLTIEPEYLPCLDGGCVLDLVEDLDGDGTYESCQTGDTTRCIGWIDNPADFQCLWGANVMPLDDCEMMHEPDRLDPEVDSDLDTVVDRGEVPQIGTGENPSAVESGCDSWSSLLGNPFSGIAQGFACALEWAFVPSSATTTQLLTDTQSSLQSVPPFSIISDLGGTIDNLRAVPTTGSCSGYVWSFEPPAMYDPTYEGVSGLPTFDASKPRLGIPCSPPFDWSIPYGFMVVIVYVGTAFGLYNLFGVAVQGPRFVHNVDSVDMASLG